MVKRQKVRIKVRNSNTIVIGKKEEGRPSEQSIVLVKKKSGGKKPKALRGRL